MKYFFLAAFLMFCAIVFWGVQTFKDRFFTDPARVEALARGIMDYRMPGPSQGAMGMDIAIDKMAMVQCAKPPVLLMLASFTYPEPPKEGEMEEKAEEFRRTNLRSEKIVVEKMTTETAVLCGQPINRIVKEGWVPQSDGQKMPVTSLQASVKNKNGYLLAVIVARGEDRQANAASVFESLTCKN